MMINDVRNIIRTGNDNYRITIMKFLLPHFFVLVFEKYSRVFDIVNMNNGSH